MTSTTCTPKNTDSDRQDAAVLNISAYKFVRLEQLDSLRGELKQLANRYELKGTILLASEGINLFVAGEAENVRPFLDTLQRDERFSNLPIKESWSESQPFNRMLVRLKKEIIAFGVDSVDPVSAPSRKISAAQLKQWLDEGKEVTLLDTRNTYEVELGTFENAVDLRIDHFKEFPARVLELPAESRDKPMVMFCTGGIRCEKAGPYVEQAGFKDVYQLDGGILRYFEECGAAHYQGDCFVFDDRVAVKPDLAPSGAVLCYACQSVLTAEELASPKYKAGSFCPHCYKTEEELNLIDLRNRQAAIDILAEDLPGCRPYTNVRPIHIPRRLAGRTLAECLTELFPQVDAEIWIEEVDRGWLRMPGNEVQKSAHEIDPLDVSTEVPSLDRIMQEGQRIDHLQPGCIEPAVDGRIRIVYQDEQLIVVSKPAGLPSHASGRFNRNTLEYLMGQVYYPEKIRLTHRLDANTSGLMVLARRFAAAKSLQQQFTEGSVAKRYIARVHGQPREDQFSCAAKIARDCGEGGVRVIDETHGLDAITDFQVIKRCDDGTTLVHAFPRTGRTNQIRCHLWHLGHPIVNDPAYLPNDATDVNFTLPQGQPCMCLHAAEVEITHPRTGARASWQDASPFWASEGDRL